MKRIMRALAAGMGLLMAGTAIPANALTPKELFQIPSFAQSSSVHFAIMTEAYRSVRQGLAARAACIQAKLISTKDKPLPAVSELTTSLSLSKDRTDQSVESFILGSIDKYCGSAESMQVADQAAVTYKPVSVKEFADVFTNDRERNYVLSLAFSTQALRIANAGDDKRGQCVVQSLTTDAAGVAVPVGLDAIKKQIFQAAASSDPSVSGRETERYVLGAINIMCGPEKAPSEEPRVAQADIPRHSGL